MKKMKCTKDNCNNTTKYICQNCKKPFCLSHLYSYVDGCNIAITKHSPLLCLQCYKEKYK